MLKVVKLDITRYFIDELHIYFLFLLHVRMTKNDQWGCIEHSIHINNTACHEFQIITLGKAKRQHQFNFHSIFEMKSFS